MAMQHTKGFALLAFIAGCATVPQQKDEAFSYAVEAVQDRSHEDGARAAWTFLESADPDDPRYDRGLRLLARSAEAMGLRYAAGMFYREIAHARRNMELVPDAIRGIQRIVETEVYDEDLLITSFIAAEEFGELPPDLKGFVDYHRGLDLARRGDYDWAEDRFEKLPESSSYAQSAQYVRAVRFVAEGDFPAAVRLLEELLEEETLRPELRRDVERSLARIAFEEERYEDALTRFRKLQELAPDDPEILLEMAWTQFYRGDSRKTLGLLIALDAPVHKAYIAPERFLLEALALRRLCQFGAARKAAVRLERKYGGALRKLSEGTLPKNIDELRAAAKLRGLSRRNTLLRKRLAYEMTILDDTERSLGKSLYRHLIRLYKRGLFEVKIREDELLRRDIVDLGEELLAAREGVRLIIHELGVSLLRGRRRPPGAQEKPEVEVPLTGQRVFYPFSGEYWTDEMDDLLIIAEDRCID